ncbi:23S rRNA (guanine2445-N2)-methyltransferase [Paraglaciecola mesophila KMM 241]|uniref:Ribosomal RNA large subunit methyltransferase K/L n=1 Tax=Paraglaciecola mesophila KMM 241 TaxID=1128912 RepID=K6ZA48_9ALTE|nr:bifunctional 23S rRNA (guanine(2069)-N(7))-methyltransferase RlmK/23S rRNA (guanine(2445)-N(2))-methyltransferase RlmL [Paraglaciecola mesophila]GAC25828.1 23S rRNA (guanine2445-N2)-methyltransferase [Paraglaciecola mesophila KMM 241]
MFEFLVTTSKGLDELLAQEITKLCPQLSVKTKPGQVLFTGEIEQAYKICLWSRLANRVMLKLADGHVDSAEDVYQITSSVNWTSHFSVNSTFVVDFVGASHCINNSQFGALKIKDAVVDQFNELFESRPSVSKIEPDIRIQGRMWSDKLTVYLDLSGSSLHQRHYRTKTGLAPVKEHIACAMLVRSGWANDQQAPLVDPMCGAGTIAIEAALMAANIAPALKRERWGFTRWLQHDATLWQSLLDDAKAQIITPNCVINASDIDHGVVSIAKENADAAGVFSGINFNTIDACKVIPPKGHTTGYIVSNPPYGDRLSEITALLPLFQAWGASLKEHFKGWNLSLLTSNRDLLRSMKMFAHKEYKLMNGKLECQLVNFALDEKNCITRETSLNNNDFANRLSKNIKRLSKWLKSEDTNCYRIYDADLPEYNVAIDRYGDWLVVQEYAAPKNVPEAKAKRRLHEVIVALPQVVDVPAEQIVMKVRAQQKGKSQYEKVSQKQKMLEVFENGAKFKLNLTDYLDTGLFLDHRVTRQLVQRRVKDKDVLNLFAYTGSVSVHAALGKARSVTTVDMSNTYVDWAKENFALNKLKGPYEFIQADCLTWLERHNNQYDFIFIDPPSFSNSKRMDTTWDVQRDHVALLRNAVKCLRLGGEIMFSNNLRQFKLDEEGVSKLGLTIQDITQKTLPEDFKRNPKIHGCWVLTLNA